MERGGYVYILTNKRNGTLYIGVTNDIQRRMYEYKNKIIKGFISKYNLNKLVFFEKISDIRDAIYNEKKLKGFKRIRKLYIIENDNPNWMGLSKNC